MVLCYAVQCTDYIHMSSNQIDDLFSPSATPKKRMILVNQPLYLISSLTKYHFLSQTHIVPPVYCTLNQKLTVHSSCKKFWKLPITAGGIWSGQHEQQYSSWFWKGSSSTCKIPFWSSDPSGLETYVSAIKKNMDYCSNLPTDTNNPCYHVLNYPVLTPVAIGKAAEKPNRQQRNVMKVSHPCSLSRRKLITASTTVRHTASC